MSNSTLRMNKMNAKKKNTMDRFNCPICYQIPENEVHQCRRGHILCDKCSGKLEQCPQCRESIRGEKRSRNLFMEETLDGLDLNCPFSDKGCKIKRLKRNELANHRSSCLYGKSIPLCELLNEDDCNFKVVVGNLKEVATHLETAHEYCPIQPLASANGQVTWEVILPEFFEPGNGHYIYVLQFKDLQLDILIVATINDDYVSWVALNLTESEWGSLSKMRIKIFSDQTPAASWTIPVFPVMEADEHLIMPMAKTCIPSLKRIREQVDSDDDGVDDDTPEKENDDVDSDDTAAEDDDTQEKENDDIDSDDTAAEDDDDTKEEADYDVINDEDNDHDYIIKILLYV